MASRDEETEIDIVLESNERKGTVIGFFCLINRFDLQMSSSQTV